MLLRYKIKNFQSFRDETEIDLTLKPKAPVRGWERTSTSGARATTALAIYGANAAGKTALLKPLAFVAWFVSRSFSADPDAEIPFQPHLASEKEPTYIELEADDRDGAVWRYELTLTRAGVIREALFRKGETRSFSYVFIREQVADGGYEVKQKGFGFAPAEAKKVRANASLISTAAQYNVDVAKHLADVPFISNIHVYGRHPINTMLTHASEVFAETEEYRAPMQELMLAWDLGLSGISFSEVEVKDTDGTVKRKRWRAFGEHITSRGERFTLPIEQESSGTQATFTLLSSLLHILDIGGVCAIDEMESDLHSMLITPIIELFDRQESNPHGAQLLFTCHSPKPLELLQKSQVYFVEKTDCESEAFRGDTIEGLRTDDNLRAKYESGSLGAIPRL